MTGLYPPRPVGRSGASAGAGWDSDLHYRRIHFGNDYLRLEDVWPGRVGGISQQLKSPNLRSTHLSIYASKRNHITTKGRSHTSFPRAAFVGHFSS